MANITNGPGMSIFQGSGKLEVDLDAEREEEEEAAADQQRRNEELQKLLTNAFDDLYDDEDNDDQSTISSIAHSDAVSAHGGDNHGILESNSPMNDRFGTPFFTNMRQESQYISSGDFQTDVQHHVMTSQTPLTAMEAYMNSRNLADTVNRQMQATAAQTAGMDAMLVGPGGDSSSVSALHYQHCFRTSPGGSGPGLRLNMGAESESVQNPNEQYRQAEYGSLEQLQVLYEVRVREVKRLAEQLEQQQLEFSQEKDQLMRKLTFKEAEKERSQLLYKQGQTLLVDSKDKIAGLEKKVVILETTVESLEKTKSQLSQELEAARVSINSLHQKISILERASINNTDKHMDAFMRNVEATHKQQMSKLENELDIAVSRLSCKEEELEQLREEYAHRQQQLELRLTEKAETVNQLAESLEKSQRQSQQLMASGAGSGQEAARLRLELDAANKDREVLQKKLSVAVADAGGLRTELQQYESLARNGFLGPEMHPGESDSLRQMGLCGGKLQADHTFDSNGKLRDELHRALLGQKLKREEIAKLSALVNSQEQQINSLHEKEKEAQSEAQRLQEKCLTLQAELVDRTQKTIDIGNKLAEVEKESQAAVVTAQGQESLNAELMEEVKRLQEEQKKLKVFEEHCTAITSKFEEAQKRQRDLEAEIERLKSHSGSTEYLEFHEQAMAQLRDEKERENKTALANIRAELELAKKECDRVKELYVAVCSSKEQLVSTLQQEKVLTHDLEKQLQRVKAEVSATSDTRQAQGNHLQATLVKLQTQLGTAHSKLDEEMKKVEGLQAENQELLEQLKLGRESLEAAQRALAEAAELRGQLAEVRAQHEAEVAELHAHRQQAVKEAEEKAHALYVARVTEEIEKAKTEAIQGLKRTCMESCKHDSSKEKQLQGELGVMQRKYEALIQRNAEDMSSLMQQLDKKTQELAVVTNKEIEIRQTLAEKEEQLNELRQGSRAASESSRPMGGAETEQIRKQLLGAFEEKLRSLQARHQSQLRESTERVKEETIRFCVQQLQQSEAKHYAAVEKCKETYEENISQLRQALEKAEKRNQEGKSDEERKCLRNKINELEDTNKKLTEKAEQMQKVLEVVVKKYKTAKKEICKYKGLLDAQKKLMDKEWRRNNSGFMLVLEQIQGKLAKLHNENDAEKLTKYMDHMKTKLENK